MTGNLPGILCETVFRYGVGDVGELNGKNVARVTL